MRYRAQTSTFAVETYLMYMSFGNAAMDPLNVWIQDVATGGCSFKESTVRLAET